MTQALEKAAKEEKEKKEAQEKMDAEAKERQDMAADVLEEQPETEESVGFLKHQKNKALQKEREEAKRKREQEAYEKELAEMQAKSNPLTNFSDKDQDDIMSMKNNMVQQTSEGMKIKKKKKGIFSRFEEKIEKEEQAGQDKQEAAQENSTLQVVAEVLKKSGIKMQ